MSDPAVESSIDDHAAEKNGVDGNGTEFIETDNLKPIQATDDVLESNADPNLKAIPASDKSHADKSSPAKRKVTATEESSEDAVSPAKKKTKAESHSSKDSGSEGDAESSQDNKAKKGTVVSDSERDDNDSEEEEDNTTVASGLLERPVVLEAGVKREKKKTQRLDIAPVVKKVAVVVGEGTKLGDLPGVEFHLSRAPSENLKLLHRVLFERPGSANAVKKNIRQFCGFGFAEGSAEYKKKHDKLSKFTNAQLKYMCEVLNIERGGKKEEIMERILHFLLKPDDSGKPVPKSGKKKRRSSGAKKASSKTPKSEKPKAKKKAKSAHDEDEESEAGSAGSDEESVASDHDNSPVESESDSDYEVKKQKKLPAKKGTKSVTPKSDAKKSSKKPPGGSPKKKATTPKKSKKVAVSSDDSSDENSEPTDDVLRNIIKKILKTANLEEVTMKTVCKQVFDKFPNFDLTSRKDFIKTTVKQVLK